MPPVLPSQVQPLWVRPLSGAGLGGIAASKDYVIVGDRDLRDVADRFLCLSARDGETIWQVQYPAPGELDYGNQPRATPLIDNDYVYLFGAFGDLTCVDLATGEIIWQKNLRTAYGTQTEFIWGMCASPLIADQKLVVNPGAADATMVALDPRSGQEIWRAPGPPPAYGSFLAADLGGKQQVVGHDRESLGGWDLQTGERLWTLTPSLADDFNVPTPVPCGKMLLITSENNGTRLYRFLPGGVLDPTPVAVNEDLAADIGTPVVVGSRLFCPWGSLFCLDVQNRLATVWTAEEASIRTHASILGGPDRVLLIGDRGELILVDATQDHYEVVSRVQVFEQGAELYSHPALVGSRLFIRGDAQLACIDLSAN